MRGSAITNTVSHARMRSPSLTAQAHMHAHVLHDRAMGRGKEGSNDELGESGLHTSRASHSLSPTMHAHTLHPTHSPTLYTCMLTCLHTLVHA